MCVGAQGKVSAAQEALEQAVGMSFGIRGSAAYACIRGQLLVAQGRDEEAERLLQAAMAMPGVKRQQATQPRYCSTESVSCHSLSWLE